MNALLVDALGYNVRGFSIIPTRGKKPTIRKWKPFAENIANEQTIRKWFTTNNPNGLAVICGKVSGDLVCRDFDEMGSYDKWALAYPNLAKTLPTSETTRGKHVFFCNKLSCIKVLGDGELRGKGYCLLPPSKPGTKQYRWINPLPNGPLPFIDPFESGLAQGVTERTESTEATDEYRETDAISGCCITPFSITNSVSEEIQQAVTSTLPTHKGTRNKQVFEFARALKAIPVLVDANSNDLRDIVRQWHELALPFIGTEPFDATWGEFVYGWPRVKFPKGSEPMVQVLERADAATLPTFAANYDCPKTHKLIKICRELQLTTGDGPFFLSCRTAGELLGIDHNTAWKRLLMLENDGILKATVRGSKKRATRYMYTAPI